MPQISTSTLKKMGCYSLKELALHKTAEDCWVSAYGRVYALPEEFVKIHVGGIILNTHKAGGDVSSFFDIHAEEIQKRWARFQVGELNPTEKKI